MAKTLPPPRGTIHRSIRLLADSLAMLGATMPRGEVEKLAITINRGMTMQGRSFHTPEHIFDLADPENPYTTLAALFHDLVYFNVDQGFSPGVKETIASSIKVDGERLSIRAAVDTGDTALRMCLEVFGFSPGDALSPFAGMNEFLSALVMNRKLGSVVSPGDLLLATACIEATIPFRRPDAAGVTATQHLEDRLTKCNRSLSLGLDASRIHQAMIWAVTFANRDVDNFSDPEVSRFLDNTWKLLPETNPSLRTQGIYTIKSYRVALSRMEEFLHALDPMTIFVRHGDVPAAEVYRAMTERAERNVLMARDYLGIKLLTATILEALSEISGGDAPVSLFMGDIGDTEPGGRLEHHLPTGRISGEPPVDRTLHDLLAVGRASVSSFDLQNSPLSLYVYLCLGNKGMSTCLAEARSMFAGDREPKAFLDALPHGMIASIARGCARMAFTRSEELDTYAAGREGSGPAA